ncbi:MAG TPA: methyltransferase [Anaerolineae bacterium]|nr:methyltransferase [Anaerolineae bacterium]
MLEVLVFLVGSIGLIYISRASLRAPRSHGFYRFFAWECILVLFLLNVDVWFHSPLAWYQLISWLLLLLCLVPLLLGVRTLRARGRSTAQRIGEPQLLAFEKTSALVTSGIYHYIRHPLYSSLLLLTWGIFFKSLTWPGFMLAVAASLFLFATGKADEAECIRFFGEPYQDYMKHSKRFVPFLF